MSKEIKVSDITSKVTKYLSKYRRKTHREINLVPSVKSEMIKTLKIRNLIFFLCIVVASASVGVTFLFGAVVGGQQLAINGKNDTIKALSSKLTDYEELDSFLTVKDQLGNIATLTSNKKVISRTFNILAAMIPNTEGGDSIEISELNVNLSEGVPTFSFEAQADAHTAPFFDYRVLDAFQKSMEYLKYDYGRYVDKDGDMIPAYCMIEEDDNGSMFRSGKDIYAYWTINAEGCRPGGYVEEENTEEENTDGEDTTDTQPSSRESDDTIAYGYETEEYAGQRVVRIWRTPQATAWYHKNPTGNVPTMYENGDIEKVKLL